MENTVKEEIVDWIVKPENEELLAILKSIKDSSSDSDWFTELTDSEKVSINNGQEDHQEQRVFTSKEFWEKHG